MTRGRRGAAMACLVLGLGIAATAQVLAPLPGPPLYDGVVPTEPYVYLSPPPGSQGGAQGAAATPAVMDGTSPLVAVATPELIPQAQIFAVPGSLTLPPGTTALSVEIAPIPAPAGPADGHISGNVYRISVTDQAGTPITAPASAQVSIVMRAADSQLLDGVVARFENGTWERLETAPAGLGGTFLAVVTEFGDFAVLAPQGGSEESASPGAGSPLPTAEPTPAPASAGPITILAAAGLAVLVVLVIAAYAVRRAGRRQAQANGRRRRR
ncbi:MAG TPA: hypothetical protein VEX41_01420 [Candidatus Eisenbacteria bacterium]|nr:hypothetical protein [Candidatus Eisenbacteria bacterium]